jgi:hypothetical protein
LPDAVSAVRHRKDHCLLSGSQLAQQSNRIPIRRQRAVAIAVAEGGSNESGQRNDDVGRFQRIRHDLFIAAIPSDHLKAFVCAAIEQTVLTIEKIIEYRNVISLIQ